VNPFSPRLPAPGDLLLQSFGRNNIAADLRDNAFPLWRGSGCRPAIPAAAHKNGNNDTAGNSNKALPWRETLKTDGHVALYCALHG